MSKNQLIEYLEELDDVKTVQEQLSQKRLSRKRESKKHESDVKLFVRAQDISEKFNFTYKAARFEEAWLLDSLVNLARSEWISDVLQKVKAGKEASVYLCKADRSLGVPYVAVKIYRPRSLRNLKNDVQYREGRADLDERGKVIRNDGDLRAMQKRTNYGEELRHQSWIAHEFQTLETLYTAGADVPKPYTLEMNALLMDYIGDVGSPAPALSSVRLRREEVHPLFERVIHNIDLMLSHKRIHGDLSAYNILYWDGDITLIDFPQVVDPDGNPTALKIFLRDVIRVCQYFAKQGLKRDAYRLASDMWTAHGLAITKDIHPGDVEDEDQMDKHLRERQKKSM